MDRVNSNGLESVYRHPGVKAELGMVRQINAFLLGQEAEFSPLIAPALETLQTGSGKMLRPLLVLLGARIAADCDYPSAGAEDFAASLNFDCTRLSAQTRRYADAIQSSRLDPGLDADFVHWKNSTSGAGGLPNRIYMLAAAIEMLHTATLVHDDIIDNSPLRRGQPTVQARIGKSQAVLLGDLLLTLCFALVNDCSATNTGSSHTGRLLSGLVRVMVRSEFLQAAERQNFERLLEQPGRRSYTRIIAGKTALLFALSLSCGAAENGGSEAHIDALRRAGFSLGMAFQIQDDILDFDAHNVAFGKPAGQDIVDRQLTLPVLLALSRPERGKAAAVQRLRELLLGFRADNTGALAAIVGLIEELGGFSGARQEAERQLRRAQGEFRKLAKLGSAAVALGQLEAVAAFFGQRRQ